MLKNWDKLLIMAAIVGIEFSGAAIMLYTLFKLIFH